MAIVEPAYAPLLNRQPLNLPAGSVRSSLVIMIMVPLWILIAATEWKAAMPLYDYFLLALVLVFYASHGGTIAPKHAVDHPSPWYLPRGFFRIGIILSTAGVIGWRVYKDPTGAELYDRVRPRDADFYKAPYLLASMLLGYVIGWAVSRLLGRLRYSPIYQDLQAAISLIATLGLGVLTTIHILINPTLKEPIDPMVLECILVGIAAWYFGARS
jgi:hypothetical protein